MARGNQKQGKALSIATRESEGSLSQRVYSPFVAEDEPVVMGLAAKYNSDEKAMARIYALIDAVSRYAGKYNPDYKSIAVKEFRQKISDAFDNLPDDIKQYLEADKTMIKDLVRGASHFANPGPDGKVYASFSTNRAHAKSFVDAQIQFDDAGVLDNNYPRSGFRVYDSNDVNGFDRIIDITRALKLQAATELYDYRKRNRDSSLPSNRKIYDEKEFLVTNIRWKK